MTKQPEKAPKFRPRHPRKRLSGRKVPNYPLLGERIVRGMMTNRWTVVALAAEIDMAPSKVSEIRNGYVMPRTEHLVAIAHALDDPDIIHQAKAYLLTGPCKNCGKTFFRNPAFQRGGQQFCQKRCHTRWWNKEDKKRRRLSSKGRVISARKFEEEAKRRAEDAEQRSEGIVDAVADFCRRCEWDGICKDAECELRDYSPLPLGARGALEVIA